LGRVPIADRPGGRAAGPPGGRAAGPPGGRAPERARTMDLRAVH